MRAPRTFIRPHWWLLALLAVASVPAQSLAVHFDDADPTTGIANAFPWGQPNGFSSLHVYRAQPLTAQGLCGPARLSEIAIAPETSGSGNYQAPQARLVIGHLGAAAIPGHWEANLSSAAVLHDLGDGPYAFPWTSGQWTPIPGPSATPFVWNGVDDIGIFFTSSGNVSGAFDAYRTQTNLRHAIPRFGATTQAPTSNGLFAMKVRLTFDPGRVIYQTNSAASSLTVDGLGSSGCSGALAQAAIGQAIRIDGDSTQVGLGWEFAFSLPGQLAPLGGGGVLVQGSNDLINLDLQAPALTFLNDLRFPPFPGAFQTIVQAPAALTVAAQMLNLTPGSPSGFELSGGIAIEIR